MAILLADLVEVGGGLVLDQMFAPVQNGDRDQLVSNEAIDKFVETVSEKDVNVALSNSLVRRMYARANDEYVWATRRLDTDECSDGQIELREADGASFSGDGSSACLKVA